MSHFLQFALEARQKVRHLTRYKLKQCYKDASEPEEKNKRLSHLRKFGLVSGILSRLKKSYIKK